MKHLSWTQRKAIYYGIQAGKSNAQIAREIGVHRSTIGREISRNAESREEYHPIQASDRSWKRQEEAMPKRRLTFFGGVTFFQKLNKHDRIYYYTSKKHWAVRVHQYFTFRAWDSFYIRPHEKKRFTGDLRYIRYRIKNKNYFPYSTKPTLKTTAPIFSKKRDRCDSSLSENQLKSKISGVSGFSSENTQRCFYYVRPEAAGFSGFRRWSLGWSRATAVRTRIFSQKPSQQDVSFSFFLFAFFCSSL